MPHRRIIVAVTVCLFCIVAGVFFRGSAAATNQRATRNSSALVAERAERIRIQRTNLKKAIIFYRQATWKWQAVASMPRTPTSYAERKAQGLGYLHWSLKQWFRRSAKVRSYVQQHPWVRLVHRTYAYRRCIIDHESRSSGVYRARNPKSTASGAYQFLDSTWQSMVDNFRRYYHRDVTTVRRAVDAPPAVQDAIAAYAIKADHGEPWQECHGIPLAVD